MIKMTSRKKDLIFFFLIFDDDTLRYLKSLKTPKTVTIPEEVYERYHRKLLTACEFVDYDPSEIPTRIVSDFVCDWDAYRCTQEAIRRRDLFGEDITVKHFRRPKGLIFFGACGSGKTQLCRILKGLVDMPMYYLPDVEKEYIRSGMDSLDDFDQPEPIILDDLGSETDAKHYGTGNMVDKILCTRYNLYQRRHIPTIVTTNLRSQRYEDSDVDGILERYGERIASRICEMFTPVCFGTRDRRKESRTLQAQ